MGSAWRRTGRRLVVLAGAIACLGVAALPLRGLRGDEPSGRFGRLFRFGGSSATRVEVEPRMAAATRRPGSPSPMAPGAPMGVEGPAIGANGPGLPPTTPLPPPTSPGGRIIPQPRVSRAVTESDPLVSRVTLGRSDGGNLFGLFLQVFADGTVLDNDGVHHLSREGIRGVLEAMESSDLFRTRGHCGGPPTDFVEQAHVVVFERSLGRLRANAFSYSGNTQGCDSSVRRLHAALDNLQMKLGQPASPAPPVERVGTELSPTTPPTGPVAGTVLPPPANAPPPPIAAPAPFGPVVAPPVIGPVTTPSAEPPPVIRLNEGAASRQP